VVNFGVQIYSFFHTARMSFFFIFAALLLNSD